MNKTKKHIGLAMALLFSCASVHAQSSDNTEREFIKENMEFASKQYNLMLKTPAQGKNGSAKMPHSMRKDGTPAKASI